MGLLINSGLSLAHQGGRRARLCRRLRYILVILRTLPCLAKVPFPQELCSRATLPLAPPPILARRTVPKRARSNGGSFGGLPSDPSGGFSWRVLKSEASASVRAYSSSSRDSLKGDAPIGLWQESKAPLQLGYLGARLGESFQYLSKHINTYFKGEPEHAQTLYRQAGVGRRGQEAGRRTQRRTHMQRPVQDRAEVEDSERGGSSGQAKVREVPEQQTEVQPSAHAGQGIQLFHISSLASRFGESYSYVARHINSVFSVGSLAQGVLDDSPPQRTRRRRRMIKVSSRVHGVNKVTEAELDSGPLTAEYSRRWEGSYLHFAHHINSYFRARVIDANPEPTLKDRTRPDIISTSTTAAGQRRAHTGSAPGLNSSPPVPGPRSPGLFHISNLATSFGESYLQMANHINQYFKGQGSGAQEVEMEGDSEELGDWSDVRGAEELPRQKTPSFTRCLLEPGTAIPELLGSYLWGGTRSQVVQPAPQASADTVWSRRVIGRKQAEKMTQVLIRRVQQASGPTPLIACIEALNEHLIQYPACKVVAWQEKAALALLGKRRCYGDNQELQGAIREALALIGYVDSVKGRGIRILSIDGGGTRGVVPLQVLKRLEAATGRQVHQLFDYVCGVSTGAVLAFMLALARISLEECEDMYHRFGSDVFRQNPLVGTMKMGWSHSYYNTTTWEGILREKMGNKVLIKTARELLSPKVSAVSAVVNWGTTPKPFIFRNYNHAPGRLSRYAGASGYQLWQAVRASSAAPGYFEEFPLHSDIHQDGGLILNNPCALAIHECRLLWPAQPFQCVLSLGTGRYDNAKRGPATATSLRAKISNLISSATDTEGVHTLLDDLMSANVYFRFNPMLSAEVSLDESRPDVMDLLRSDTELYLDRNQHKVERLCKVLGPERGALRLSGDWIGERVWELRQRWS